MRIPICVFNSSLVTNVRLVKAIDTLLHTFTDALYRPGMVLISLWHFRFDGLLLLHFVLHIFHTG